MTTSHMGTSQSPEMHVLHSWKEISSYTGRGVRTLQRYEVLLGFPIHRPSGRPRSSVLAFKHEIDQWMTLTPSSAPTTENGTVSKVFAGHVHNAGNDVRDLCFSGEQWSETANSVRQHLTSTRGALTVSTNSSSSDVQVLHSWKEISSYTGCGVRTLQRYETNLSFPVHRPLGKPRSSVMAFKHEIDRWLSETPSSALKALDGPTLSERKVSDEALLWRFARSAGARRMRA